MPWPKLRGRLTGKEKRTSPRYVCDGGVEVLQSGRSTGFWGTLTDISVSGCYVQTFTPIAAGTELSLKVHIKGDEHDIILAGKVRTWHPGVGMGIQFTELHEEDRKKLEHLLLDLSKNR